MKNMVRDFQFLLPSNGHVPDGFVELGVGAETLLVDQRFHHFPIYDQAHAVSGLVIGFPYHQDLGEFLVGGSGEDYKALLQIGNIDELEADLLPKLAGSFVIFTWGSLPKRIYLDHGGSIPMVYDRLKKMAATSVSMILDDAEYDQRFNKPLYEKMVNYEGIGGWIPGTLTAHHDIERLLPNHYLDLDSGDFHRYWPRPFLAADFMPLAKAAEQIVTSMSAFSSACFRTFRTSQTLTAGYDSRLLLAVCHDFIDKTCFFTMMAEGSQRDVDVSKTLSERFGLKHNVIPLIKSSEDEKAIWDRAVGDAIREINREIFPTLKQLDEVDFIITGAFGEVGRCRYYRQDYMNVNDLPINSEIILSRLTVPIIHEVKENIDAWLSGLEGIPNSAIFDLVVHELKTANWGMGQNPIQNSMKYNLYPFALRPVIDAFIRTDPAEKKTGNLFDACIERSWPELVSIPVNKYGDYRDYLIRLRKLFNLNRLRRYTRDRIARYR